MKVRAKQVYRDLQLNRIVKPGEEIDVSIDRAKFLLSLGLIEKFKEEATETVEPEVVKEPKVPKKPAKKKAK